MTVAFSAGKGAVNRREGKWRRSEAKGKKNRRGAQEDDHVAGLRLDRDDTILVGGVQGDVLRHEEIPDGKTHLETGTRGRKWAGSAVRTLYGCRG